MANATDLRIIKTLRPSTDLLKSLPANKRSNPLPLLNYVAKRASAKKTFYRHYPALEKPLPRNNFDIFLGRFSRKPKV